MATPTQCADELLETVPLLMRVIRTNVRTRAGSEFSVPQFRALAYLGRNEDAMLSEVAAFLGLTHPAASKLVDGLVESGFVSREGHPTDRRRVSLGLTKHGHRKYETVLTSAQQFISSEMQHLSPDDLDTVASCMQILHRIFASAPDDERRREAMEQAIRHPIAQAAPAMV